MDIESIPESLPLPPGFLLPIDQPISKANRRAERKEKKKKEHEALLALTQAMIAQKQDLNQPFKDGEFKNKTILTVAAMHRANKSIIKDAIKAGADANAVDGKNQTPIQVATCNFCASTLKCLAKHNATLKNQGLIQEICSPWHDTLNIDLAFKRVKTLTAILNKANEQDAKELANELDPEGNTALFHLLWKWDPISQENPELYNLYKNAQKTFYLQRKQMIDELLDAGLNERHTNLKGESAVVNIETHPDLKDPELITFLQERIKEKELAKLLGALDFSRRPLKKYYYFTVCFLV